MSDWQGMVRDISYLINVVSKRRELGVADHFSSNEVT